ncbi:MAG: hypothetical protein EBR82_30065 [Caulobacteraceae bacterium]|nr:hypothetical protein [Caulobacteraceae bacterium]
MAAFFTSDQHYDHKNIIKYCNRPFKTIDHMVEEMIVRHNSVVAADDVVWHLGDFCLNAQTVDKILPRLNGTHHLVCGNHDAVHPMKKSRDRFIKSYHDAGFFSIWSELRIEIEGVGTALLHHMPYTGDNQTSNRYEEWRPKRGNEALQIHGHVHEKWKVRPGMINVGVDVWDYAPVSLEQIKSVYIPPERGTVST